MTPARHRHLRNLVCSVLDSIPPKPTKLPDVMFFVISKYKGETYVVERTTDRMTREKTLADIRSGDLTDIQSIIETEFTAAGLSSRDVTAPMLMEADLMRGLAPEPVDRQANTFDHDRKLRVEAM